MTTHGCDRCHHQGPDRIYARLSRLGPWLCTRCWSEMGQPWWMVKHESGEAVHASELAIRDAMTRRGDTDRHMVRVGRT